MYKRQNIASGNRLCLKPRYQTMGTMDTAMKWTLIQVVTAFSCSGYNSPATSAAAAAENSDPMTSIIPTMMCLTPQVTSSIQGLNRQPELSTVTSESLRPPLKKMGRNFSSDQRPCSEGLHNSSNGQYHLQPDLLRGCILVAECYRLIPNRICMATTRFDQRSISTCILILSIRLITWRCAPLTDQARLPEHI